MNAELIYVVIEEEAAEDGKHYRSLIAASDEKSKADDFADSQDTGRFTRYIVEPVKLL